MRHMICTLALIIGPAAAFSPHPTILGPSTLVSSSLPQAPQKVSTRRTPPAPPRRNHAGKLKADLGATEAIAGALFPLSLPPYLAFLYFAAFEANNMPKLSLNGFRFLLVFVGGSIPAAIAASVGYGVVLADCDWLHGGAEGLLTITNLLIVLGFRGDAGTRGGREAAAAAAASRVSLGGGGGGGGGAPLAAERGAGGEAGAAARVAYPAAAVALLTGGAYFAAAAAAADPFADLTAVSAAVSAAEPTLLGLGVHAPFLGGVGDLPEGLEAALFGWARPQPANTLSVATWAIHTSSLVEWLVAMGLVWKFADTVPNDNGTAAGAEESGGVGNPRWRGVTWGMLPLHSSGICACTYHLFYNQPAVGFLVALQALLTCVGNATLAFATYRLAVSNGWNGRDHLPGWAARGATSPALEELLPGDWAGRLREGLLLDGPDPGAFVVAMPAPVPAAASAAASAETTALATGRVGMPSSASPSSPSSMSPPSSTIPPVSPLVGFEDIGEGLRGDDDANFVGKLLLLSVGGSYLVKYGELGCAFPFDADGAPATALAFIAIPTALNVAKWASRSTDPDKKAFDMF